MQTSQTTQTKEWKIARTMAHLWIGDRFTGISVSIKNLGADSVPTPAQLDAMNLPPLPRKG